VEEVQHLVGEVDTLVVVVDTKKKNTYV